MEKLLDIYNKYPEFCLDFYEKYQKNLDFFNKDKYLLMYYYNEVFTNKLYKININSNYFDENKWRILNYHNSLINVNNDLTNLTLDESSSVCINVFRQLNCLFNTKR